MPLFEYRCMECGGVSEHFQQGSQREKPICFKCGSAKLERIKFSTFAVGSSSTLPECGSARECNSCCGGGSCRLKS